MLFVRFLLASHWQGFRINVLLILQELIIIKNLSVVEEAIRFLAASSSFL